MKFSFERQVNETLWYAIMKKAYQGDDFYENDTFIVRPYSWVELDDPDDNHEYNENDYKYHHDNDWHFWHKPSGFKLSWYKYPLRSPLVNLEITHEQFYAILKDCMNSVPEAHPYENITFTDSTFKKWWEENK